MRAARIATSSEHALAPLPAPLDAAPVQEAAVRIAAEHDMASISPVHAMQAQLQQAYNRRPRAQQLPLRFDPVRLALLVYTLGFWWGMIALATAMVHGWVKP